MNERGFSLIEILVATVIVTIGGLIGSNLGVGSKKNLAYDRNTVTASEIASNILEDLLNRNYGDPDLAAGAHASYYDQNEKVVEAASPYTAVWNVSWNTPIPDIMDVKLQVSWDYSGTHHILNFETFRSSK